ncbi:hypothetical protein H1C71_008099 [Ictidomys tridecemlineatus]|nr:hypothetical protein H1C71_008099 [Ictidomys tridecemlineatus]
MSRTERPRRGKEMEGAGVGRGEEEPPDGHGASLGGQWKCSRTRQSGGDDPAAVLSATDLCANMVNDARREFFLMPSGFRKAPLHRERTCSPPDALHPAHVPAV